VLVNTPDVEIAWIYDRRRASAQDLARAYGLRALHSLCPEQLPVCDVVLLAIPWMRAANIWSHLCSSAAPSFAKSRLRRVRQPQQLIDRFAPHALGAGFMRRFFRSTILLRQIVAHGDFRSLTEDRNHEGNRSRGSGIDASF